MARLLPYATRSLVALFAIGPRTSLAFSPISRLKGSPSSQGTFLTMSSKRVLVPIGDGSEEIETTCITDTLTRFGAEVTIASVMSPKGDLVCKMSRGIKVVADIHIDDATKEEWDLVALPGGMPGATNLRDSEALMSILEKQKNQSKPYAAICASPAVVLAEKGLLSEGSTCYPAPSFREKLTNPSDNNVVVIGGLTTSKGPGTALEFALELGQQLFGKEMRDKIQSEMLVETK